MSTDDDDVDGPPDRRHEVADWDAKLSGRPIIATLKNGDEVQGRLNFISDLSGRPDSEIRINMEPYALRDIARIVRQPDLLPPETPPRRRWFRRSRSESEMS